MNVQQAAEICDKAKAQGHDCICQFIVDAIDVERAEVVKEIQGLELHDEGKACTWFSDQPCTCNLRMILKVIRGDV